MEETQQPSADKGVPRTSQACQRCRSLKTRCLPSQQQGGTCQRCFSAKRDCVWADASRRARKSRGPSRISQVEQKIDGLVATLTQPNVAQATDAPRERPPSATARIPIAPGVIGGDPHKKQYPGSWLPMPLSMSLEVDSEAPDPEHDNFLDKLRTIHSFGEDVDMSRPPKFSSAKRSEPTVNSEILNRLLASGEAERLLKEYRNMSASLPFVPIPTLAAQELYDTKPMLFLAVMTVGSWNDHQRQMSLDDLYRRELANRTIISPKRTLSLVQSLVVYISWYHFVFSHKTQQVFSLIQLAIGFALDLGLHQKTKRLSLEMPGHRKPSPPAPEVQRERQRTFLGCYYLSSSVSSSFQKPNLLKYNDYIAECTKSLRTYREYPSDEIISSLVNLRRLDDQVQDTLHTDDTLDLPITDSRINMNLRFMESQLDQWKRDNVGYQNHRALNMLCSVAEMQLNSIALRPIPDAAQLGHSSSLQLNGLLSTLESGKCFLDYLLAIPLTDYHQISFSEWMRIPHVIITIARLSIPCDAHASAQWDVKAAQDRVRLDLYIEALCYRCQALSTFDKIKQPHPDFWSAMKMIMDLTKTWYCRKISKQSSSSYNLPTPDTSADGYSITNHFNSLDTSGTAQPNQDTGNDPFAFMRSMEFDMDQFLETNIWGHESYEDMGFGGGMDF